MYSNEPRCQYKNNQLAEVICQLRFPDILTVNSSEPAAFQEIIRAEFPQYAKRTDHIAPKIVGVPGNLRLETPPAITNYHFVSADGVWRVNLTSRFISLTCTQYSNWEEFAHKLDIPLAAFIKTYKPAYFQRIGLRYLNFVSRSSLGLEDEPFSNLFAPTYLGLLGSNEISDSNVNQNSVDAELSIRDGCRLKIHAGPGIVKKNGHTDNEVKFVFDEDLFVVGNIPVNHAPASLENIHTQAYSIFRGAITDTLHNAMQPF